MKFAAIVVAAGNGLRFGGKVAKQFVLLCGMPVVAYSLQALQKSEVEAIVLVVGAGQVEFCRKEIVDKYGFTKVTAVVEGGEERYLSVQRGLAALPETEYVLIQDGARPFLTSEILDRAMRTVIRCGACAAGMPVKDTIKRVNQAGIVIETPPREELWQVQTPQAFAIPLIREAYEKLSEHPEMQVTDDAMAVEQMLNVPVTLFPGSYENIKITTPEDLILAEALISERGAEQ